jgi:hypothetical protein
MKNMAISPKRINAEYGHRSLIIRRDHLVRDDGEVRFVPHVHSAGKFAARHERDEDVERLFLRNDRLHLLFRNEILLDGSVELYGIAMERRVRLDAPLILEDIGIEHMTVIDGKDGGIVPDKQTDLLNILLEVLLTEDDVDVLDQFAHFVRLEVLILRPGFQQQFDGCRGQVRQTFRRILLVPFLRAEEDLLQRHFVDERDDDLEEDQDDEQYGEMPDLEPVMTDALAYFQEMLFHINGSGVLSCRS